MRRAARVVPVLLVILSTADCRSEELLFADTFDAALSNRWELVALNPNDVRIRDGSLEVRVQPGGLSSTTPLLKVNLPFRTSDRVTASVECTVAGPPLARNELAALLLLDGSGISFSARKVNLDGYFVLSPGEVDFIGTDGEEGDPGKYTVKYWPADPAAGPLRIIVQQHYAHFQVGPSKSGAYQTFFHSAIRKQDGGMAFGLTAAGAQSDAPRWVRFDNFKVWRN